MTSPGVRRVTHRVWRGVLLMWRNPDLAQSIQNGSLPDNIKQKDVDCVLRAVDWAQAMEGRHK